MFNLPLQRLFNRQMREQRRLQRILSHAKPQLGQVCLEMTKGLSQLSQNGSQVFGLTSRQKGEGVTTVSFGLAAALSSQLKGKLLLILTDGNTAGDSAFPSLASLDDSEFSINAVQPSAIGNERKFSPEDFAALGKIEHSKTFGFDVLTAHSDHSPIPSNPAVWAQLKSAYQCILVDAGPWTGATARAWNSGIDEMFLVVDVSTTTREKLVRFKKELTHSQEPTQWKGIIMNKRVFPIPNFLYPLLG